MAILLLSPQNDQKAQQNGKQRIGIEDDINQIALFPMEKRIHNQITGQNRKSDNN